MTIKERIQFFRLKATYVVAPNWLAGRIESSQAQEVKRLQEAMQRESRNGLTKFYFGYEFSLTPSINNLEWQAGALPFGIILTEKLYQEGPNIYGPIVLHEIGHRERGHVSSCRDAIKISLNRLFFGSIKEELEADQFAAKLVGSQRMIHSLRFLAEKVPDGKREIDIRIKELETLNYPQPWGDVPPVHPRARVFISKIRNFFGFGR